MSAVTKPADQSKNQEEQQDQAAQANQGAGTPSETITSPPEVIAEQPAKTEEEKAADMVAAVAKANPHLKPDEIGEIVAKIFNQTKADKIETKVDREVARLVPAAVLEEDRNRVFIKGDKKKEFPVDKSALENYIVRQSVTRKLEDDTTVEVAAKHLNEFAVYTEEEYERLSVPKTGGFARANINVEVLHEPGQKDNVQD